ncbi:MAG: TfoX/Sxy family DNA transformation protein [Thomasclavelia ramosa]
MGGFTNIGKVVAQQLIQVGIDDQIKLKEVGAKEAWLKIQQIDESACIHRLYALEGQLRELKTQLDYETKAELKQFYNEHKL